MNVPYVIHEGLGCAELGISAVAVGDKIKFQRIDGQICEDVVRAVFYQRMMHSEGPAVVLIHHSWTYEDTIVEINGR